MVNKLSSSVSSLPNGGIDLVSAFEEYLYGMFSVAYDDISSLVQTEEPRLSLSLRDAGIDEGSFLEKKWTRLVSSPL